MGRDSTTVVLRPGGVERVFVVRPREPAPRAPAVRTADAWLVWSGGVEHEIPVGPAPRRAAASGQAHLNSPLPGQVIAVRVGAGEAVREGDELVVVEAMKMEHAIRAPSDGTIAAVLCAPADKVERGQALVDFRPA
jgi:biotin carboxyl carrier protein